MWYGGNGHKLNTINNSSQHNNIMIDGTYNCLAVKLWHMFVNKFPLKKHNFCRLGVDCCTDVHVYDLTLSASFTCNGYSEKDEAVVLTFSSSSR